MARTIIRNIGCLVSGDFDRPIVDADTVALDGDQIVAIGKERDIGIDGADPVINVQGATVAPGFIDTHAHPVCGDFQPRAHVVDHTVTALECGLTSFVSAGETHYPGRPRDAAGVKALSLLACKSYFNAPPGNVRYYAGSVLLEKGLTEGDFKDLAEAGVRFVGEIGVSGAQDPVDIKPMVAWARQYGMRVMCHTGGPSGLPGCGNMTAETILQIDPDILSHINGGPTALSDDQVRRLVEESRAAIEIVFTANLRTARDVIGMLRERRELHRVILGTDMPSGAGFVPMCHLCLMAFLSSVGGVAPEQAVAMCTGNAARVLGIPGGYVRKGEVADLVVMDSTPGSAGANALSAIAHGDMVAICMVILRGEVVTWPSRYTPRARRPCVFDRGGPRAR